MLSIFHGEDINAREKSFPGISGLFEKLADPARNAVFILLATSFGALVGNDIGTFADLEAKIITENRDCFYYGEIAGTILGGLFLAAGAIAAVRDTTADIKQAESFTP